MQQHYLCSPAPCLTLRRVQTNLSTTDLWDFRYTGYEFNIKLDKDKLSFTYLLKSAPPNTTNQYLTAPFTGLWALDLIKVYLWLTAYWDHCTSCTGQCSPPSPINKAWAFSSQCRIKLLFLWQKPQSRAVAANIQFTFPWPTRRDWADPRCRILPSLISAMDTNQDGIHFSFCGTDRVLHILNIN